MSIEDFGNGKGPENGDEKMSYEEIFGELQATHMLLARLQNAYPNARNELADVQRRIAQHESDLHAFDAGADAHLAAGHISDEAATRIAQEMQTTIGHLEELQAREQQVGSDVNTILETIDVVKKTQAKLFAMIASDRKH